MTKYFLWFILISSITSNLEAQFITLRPGPALGKDAYLRSLSPNQNLGQAIDFLAHAWTNSGQDVFVRGLIEFDLDTIPTNAIIDSAFLSLYSFNSPANGHHETTSGSNESFLRRVLQPWEEDVVTWNNQPATTIQNEVLLDSTISPIQHFENIDVSELIKDMIANPQQGHGFLFQLKTEQKFRRMLFSSSDNPDSTLHPKLEVYYSIVSNLKSKTPKPDLIKFSQSLWDNTLSIVSVTNEPTNLKFFSPTGKLLSVHQIQPKETLILDLSFFSEKLLIIRGESFNGQVQFSRFLIF